MDAARKFEISVRQRLPYVTSSVLLIGGLCLAILFIFYLIMLPTSHASAEISTAYYILVVPGWLKTVCIYARIGFIIAALSYYSLRSHTPAELIVYESHILIRGEKIDLHIPAKTIDKIYGNDLQTILRQPKGILQFVIKQKRRKTTTVRLERYDQGDEVLGVSSRFTNVPFAFYEDNMLDDDDE